MSNDTTLLDRVLAHLRANMKAGDHVVAKDIHEHFKDTNLHTLQNSLWVLMKKGYLDKPRGKGTRGLYFMRGRRSVNGTSPVVTRAPRKVQAPKTGPVQAIYDLLDFMAKAEPALKRAAKILEAVDNA